MTLDLLVDALAVYRASRIVTADSITERPRAEIVRWSYGGRLPSPFRWSAERRRFVTDQQPAGVVAASSDVVKVDDDPPKVAELVTCYWCSGMYVALGAVAARRWAPGLWGLLSRALALSAAGALIAGLEQD